MTPKFFRTPLLSLVLCGLSLLAVTSLCRAEVLSKIAAVVNDDIITTFELEKEVTAQIAAQARGQSLVSEELAKLRRQTLQRMIEETLVRQQVRELGIEVAEEELEEAITDVLKQNNITRAQLSQALAGQGMSFEEYRAKMRQQILRFKLIGREVQNKVEVSSQEIRDYFREHIEDYRGDPFVRLAYINFAIPRDESVSNAQVAAIRERAREALALLRQGEEFYSTLFIYSTDPDVDGGELGTFTEDELSPAFARAIAGLEEGQVTELIENPEGFYILRVEERNPGPIRQFDMVKDEIRQRLMEKNREERFAEWSAGLKKNAYIDIRI